MFWKKALDAILGGDVIGSIIKKLPGREKMSEAEAAQAELELRKSIEGSLQRSEDSFRDFFIKYEGEAKDMPRAIQVLRGSVRPVITYLALIFFAITAWRYISLVGTASLEQLSLIGGVLQLLFWLNIITLTFWFGEKVVTRSGLVDVFRQRFNGGGK